MSYLATGAVAGSGSSVAQALRSFATALRSLPAEWQGLPLADPTLEDSTKVSAPTKSGSEPGVVFVPLTFWAPGETAWNAAVKALKLTGAAKAFPAVHGMNSGGAIRDVASTVEATAARLDGKPTSTWIYLAMAGLVGVGLMYAGAPRAPRRRARRRRR